MKNTGINDTKNNPFPIEIRNLLEDLHSGHVEKFTAAVDILRNIDDPRSQFLISEITPLLNHVNPEIRCDSIELLLLISPSKTIDLVLPLLADPVDFVRNCVCQELEFHEYYDKKVVEPLINSLLHDPFNDVRYKAAVLLGKIGDNKARQALEWVYKNDNGENYEGDSISARAKWALDELRSS